MVLFDQAWLRSGCDFMIRAAMPKEKPASMMTIGMLDSVLATALTARKLMIATAIGSVQTMVAMSCPLSITTSGSTLILSVPDVGA